MDEQTPNLTLPYIMAAQAQKHVTHNEGIRMLDALVQIAVLDRDMTAPPSTPANGDRYIVPGGALGAWAGHVGSIAAFQDGAWAFYAPRTGWTVWIADEGVQAVWSGAAWIGASASVPMLGINATADITNRLSLASSASLFDNVGAGHQQKINKNATGDTASQLYQTNYSGRAEIGLIGDDKLRFKTSADGSAWTNALVIDPATAKTTVTSIESGAMGVRANFGDFRVLTANGRGWRFGSASAGSSLGGFYLQGTGDEFIASFMTAVWFGTNGYVGINTGSSPSNPLSVEGIAAPETDNAYTLGTSGKRWSTVYAATGTINTSDARDKEVAHRIAGSFAAGVVDAVEPAMYRWKVGGNVRVQHETETEPCPTGTMVPSPTETTVNDDGQTVPAMVPLMVPKMITQPVSGSRLHAGFIAQEIKAQLDAAGVDFGVWGLDDVSDPDSRQWLRPDQMVPLLWAALRETRMELSDLKARLP